MTEYKSWDELTVLEQMGCQYWDMYKDAYGVRPRGIDTSTWTVADFEAEFSKLGKVIDRNFAEQQIQEADAIAKFEQRVQRVIVCGATDKETAMRWIMEGSDCNGDWSYFAYCNGLPYNYFTK